jgi:coenzyme PQQ precursor peptide PqqA
MARRRTLHSPSSPAGGCEAVDKLHLCSILPPARQHLLRCSKTPAGTRGKKISLANSPFGGTYRGGRNSSGSKKESQMAWKAPKIIEVPVGMEINMYACAARK